MVLFVLVFEPLKVSMKHLSNETIVLIDKYHSGEASDEEVSILLKWKSASSSNLENYHDLINLLELIQSVRVWKQFDQNRAWLMLQNNISFKALKLTWIRYVAAAILLFVLVATVWDFSGKTEYSSPSYLSGSESKFSILKDGSELFLEKGSKIYTQHFTKNSRIIETEGSYFVNVEPDVKHPFKINTSRLSIEVLGTSFKVEEDEISTRVKVREGKVLITSSDGAKYNLGRNEMLTLAEGQVSLGRVGVKDWGLFSQNYEDESILHLMQDLKDQFGKLNISGIVVDPECKITTKIVQSTMLEILHEIGLIFQVDYKIKDGIVIVNNISC